ncbi:KH domain-containing protein [Patescibacteria group bacterium]|nr:KH domain-containing protein [Patescibacteria group bacterium]
MNNEHTKILIEEFLNNLTIGFDTVEIIEDDIRLVFLIKTEHSGVLIGNNGENLRALNHIIKRMVGKKQEKESEMQFLLDVNGYYQKKIQRIRDQATILADRARMFKSNVEMTPMNAYERMIIHSMFTDDPEISTESSGVGKLRRVVLKYGREERKGREYSEMSDSIT